ncbi:fluoride efflux transporter CrcB [Streptomyces sp. NBC_00102]|uniref:fluoride efflux transporter CrcB n=1 Tax=Streptomyces sp. NBC_00102 TaxID=2975652 RepID=UPI002255C432|nr:fluoride efflux transporter CrcB [Streptomyces sp. NBC_00102]MCX5398061.1 fluoride efflux transporter CrcB [Streptomyces sp. NBC_00102]
MLPEPPARPGPREASVLGVVAVGGALGATARYAATLAWPTDAAAFPWTVFVVNVAGCALIGVLMVLTAELSVVTRPLVRPFLGVGVLGGFTTFSTYAADVSKLLQRQEALTAMAYTFLTLVAALGSVWASAVVTRKAVARARGTRMRGTEGGAR